MDPGLSLDMQATNVSLGYFRAHERGPSFVSQYEHLIEIFEIPMKHH